MGKGREPWERSGKGHEGKVVKKDGEGRMIIKGIHYRGYNDNNSDDGHYHDYCYHYEYYYS